MGINAKSFLNTIKKRVYSTAAPVVQNAWKTEINRAKTSASNYKSRENVQALARKYGLSETRIGANNYDRMIKKAWKMMNRGDMVGIRNYFKSQKKKFRKDLIK